MYTRHIQRAGQMHHNVMYNHMLNGPKNSPPMSTNGFGGSFFDQFGKCKTCAISNLKHAFGLLIKVKMPYSIS